MKSKPKKNSGDIAHAIAKASLSMIPIVGGAAAEIFSQVITPPIVKRQAKWIESIAEGLKRLEEKETDLTTENLTENDTFVTTVMQASQIAIRNHQKEKLKALQNAVLNAALPNAPEADLQLMFLNYIDTLTSWHLRVLKLLDDPENWGRKHGIRYPKWTSMGSPALVIMHAFPELRDRLDLIKLLVRDLYTRGLVTLETATYPLHPKGMLLSRRTAMGRLFLHFITHPFEVNEK